MNLKELLRLDNHQEKTPKMRKKLQLKVKPRLMKWYKKLLRGGIPIIFPFRKGFPYYMEI